jgi:hypothetical protein
MRLRVVVLMALGLFGRIEAAEPEGVREGSPAVAGLRALGGGLRDQARTPMDYIRRVSDADWIREEAHAAMRVAAEVPKVRPGWKASVAAVVVASVVDVHSSWGKQEANPVLASGDGRFGARGVAIKSLITGGALGAQWLLLRKKP